MYEDESLVKYIDATVYRENAKREMKSLETIE